MANCVRHKLSTSNLVMYRTARQKVGTSFEVPAADPVFANGEYLRALFSYVY
jgi:hypothetical protein